MGYLIVTHCQEAEEIIREKLPEFSEAPVIRGTVTVEDVKGKVVAGNLPLHLAQYTRGLYVFEIESARIAHYRVIGPANLDAVNDRILDGVVYSSPVGIEEAVDYAASKFK